jgi:hypothetical protein
MWTFVLDALAATVLCMIMSVLTGCVLVSRLKASGVSGSYEKDEHEQAGIETTIIPNDSMETTTGLAAAKRNLFPTHTEIELEKEGFTLPTFEHE